MPAYSRSRRSPFVAKIDTTHGRWGFDMDGIGVVMLADTWDVVHSDRKLQFECWVIPGTIETIVTTNIWDH